MPDLVRFERHQRMHVLFPDLGTKLSVEITEVEPRQMMVKLIEEASWLEENHLRNLVDLRFWARGTLYECDQVKILSHQFPRGQFTLARPMKKKELMRRQTFRETVQVPITMHLDEGNTTVDLNGPQVAVTQDLSGGGCCVETPMDLALHIDDEFELELNLPQRKVKARAQVRWAKAQEEQGTRKVGLAFTQIDERERDTVFGFLFELQRSRRPGSARA